MNPCEIRLRIREESDLYNPFDESGETLSGDVTDYIVEQLSEIDIGQKPVLIIKSDDPVDAERLKRALQKYLAVRDALTKKQRKINMIRQLRLFVIGFVFVMAAIIMNGRVHPVLEEIISIVGSFSIWEAANIWIVENPKIRLE